MEKLLIVDFGSQFTQLIARRVREINIYCEIFPFYKLPKLDDYKAVILSGSPHSVLDKEAPLVDLKKFKEKKILGICFGAQMIVNQLGGEVKKSNSREYGRTQIVIEKSKNDLVNGIGDSDVWMSHSDTISDLPKGFEIVAKSKQSKAIAIFSDKKNSIFGLQFHPEVYHTINGKEILRNFLVNICGFSQKWTPKVFINEATSKFGNLLKNDKVILALSGGVDSTVTAVLLSKIIEDRLICVFVNNGLLRKNEYNEVLNRYKNLGLNVIGLDESQLFYDNLKGVEDPEEKRKIIGGLFIDCFQKIAQQRGNIKWLGQGTIYPDVIESVSVNGPSQTIKSHHNVGGLPDRLNMKLVEPMRNIFKDEVREVGVSLGIDQMFLKRHPFPGPGLAIRILGEVTEERVKLLREVDDIFINKLVEYNIYDSIWQAGAILLPVKSVGVMGDERTYENVVSLRAVESVDGMTADWFKFPYEILSEISNEIINNVKGVNRVVYDISSKPPATIEWE